MNTLKFLFGFCLILVSNFAYSENVGEKQLLIPKESIITEELKAEDQKWFEKEFVETFLNEYIPLSFTIGPKNSPKIIGPKNIKEKKALLTETVKEEFKEYVLQPKDGYKAIKILVDGKPVSALLFRLKDKEKVIYLAQFFVCKDFSRKGLATYTLEKLIREMFPTYKKYEVLTRYQNVAACAFYSKLQYQEDKTGKIAESYGYDPSRYKSLYKVFE